MKPKNKVYVFDEKQTRITEEKKLVIISGEGKAWVLPWKQEREVLFYLLTKYEIINGDYEDYNSKEDMLLEVEQSFSYQIVDIVVEPSIVAFVGGDDSKTVKAVKLAAEGYKVIS